MPDPAASEELVARTERRLVLVRHAKSDWPDGVADHERPLADRGRRDAAALGRWLRDTGVVPDLVVVSTARRTRQTWELAGESTGATRVVLDDRVYAAEVDDLVAVVRGTPTEVACLVVVGHSPGTERLALLLDDGSGYGADARRLALKFPTSGVAVLDVPVRWSEVSQGSCRLAVVAAPRG